MSCRSRGAARAQTPVDPGDALLRDLHRRREQVERRAARPVVGRPAGEAERQPHVPHVGDPKARQACAEQIDVEPVDERQESGEREQPLAPPNANGRTGGAFVFHAVRDDRLFPRFDDDPRRRAGQHLEPQAARAAGRFVSPEPEQKRVDGVAREGNSPHRQRHGRLHLHEPAQPAGGEIDLLFAIVGRTLHGDLETLRVDAKPRVAIGAELLELVVQVPRVVDVRRAELRGRGRAEGRVAIDGETAVARFVGRETFEEANVVGDGNDRVAGHQQPPQLLIVPGEIVRVFLPSVPIGAAMLFET